MKFFKLPVKGRNAPLCLVLKAIDHGIETAIPSTVHTSWSFQKQKPLKQDEKCGHLGVGHDHVIIKSSNGKHGKFGEEFLYIGIQSDIVSDCLTCHLLVGFGPEPKVKNIQ